MSAVFREFRQLSPNVSPGAIHERRGVLFHHTVMSFDATIARMADPASEVSYHAVIASDGTRCCLVPDEQVAWHAGVSTFHGRTGCNRFLLGLAFAGDTYAEPLTGAQIESALEWLTPRWALHRWTLDWMSDHRQVAPGRKDDLNPTEWDRLYRTLEQHFGQPR